VYSSLKLNAPDAGRVMIEDWLAVREPQYANAHGDEGEGEGDGYAKVLELYCVHILPKLGLWDYAKEFLGYESELSADRREVRHFLTMIALSDSFVASQNHAEHAAHPSYVHSATVQTGSFI
jgi:hypothetical protein